MSSFARYFRLILVILLIPGLVLSGSIIISQSIKAAQNRQRVAAASISTLTAQITHQLEEDMITYSLLAQSNIGQALLQITEQEMTHQIHKLGLFGTSIASIVMLDEQYAVVSALPTKPTAELLKQVVRIGPYHLDEVLQINPQTLLLAHKIPADRASPSGYILALLDLQRTFPPLSQETAPFSSLEIHFENNETRTGQNRTCMPGTIRYFGREYTPIICGILDHNILATFSIRELLFLPIVVLLMSTIVALLLAWRIAKNLQAPIQQLSELIKGSRSDNKQYNHILTQLQSRKDEFGQLAQTINDSRETIEDLQAEKQQLLLDAAVGQLAAQVSHDIRSPLTALRVLVGHLAGVPEEHRVMIRNAVQRIEDIANDLRAKQELALAVEGEVPRTDDRSVQLLSSLIEPLISEQRTQHRAKLGVEIHAALDAESYGLFAVVHPTELKRVISNLINNAVEAMDRGLVTVAVRQEAKQVVITVTDTGRGIPPELLPQLMQHGATFGKTGGSGLGLYHARMTMESWGGMLALSSRVGVGTTATVTLPRAEEPAWFVPELVLTPGSTIVIVDDDVSIHQIWQERLEAVDLPTHEIALQHFSSGTEVVAWFHGQANTLFLCDYEFLGQPNNGLELIAQLGVPDRAILVTSHYEEAPIQLRCADLGVRLIPKGLAGFVPIRVIARSATAHVADASTRHAVLVDAVAASQHDASEKPTALVLDDDDGIRCVWPMEGRRLGLSSVTTFASMEECEAASPDYAQFDFAFVDKNIPDSAWRLDQVIAHLKACGVKKVLVASGESARALANDPLCAAADGVIPMKIPQRLPV